MAAGLAGICSCPASGILASAAPDGVNSTCGHREVAIPRPGTGALAFARNFTWDRTADLNAAHLVDVADRPAGDESPGWNHGKPAEAGSHRTDPSSDPTMERTERAGAMNRAPTR